MGLLVCAKNWIFLKFPRVQCFYLVVKKILESELAWSREKRMCFLWHPVKKTGFCLMFVKIGKLFVFSFSVFCYRDLCYF